MEDRATTPAVMYRDQVARWRERFARLLDGVPPAGHLSENFLDRLVRATFTMAVEELDAILAGQCPEDPQRLRGQPIGQYHCPRCGCMTLAGVPHLHGDECWLGLNEAETAAPLPGP